MKTTDYLETLRRIPDDIVLSMAARMIEPEEAATCICGWAIREALARQTNKDAAECEAPWFSDVPCVLEFGGSYDEWYSIYNDIAQMDRAPLVEEAFVTRVMEAAGVA